MKKFLCLLLVIFSTQVCAAQFSRDDLIGQWRCKTVYKDKEGKTFAVELRDGINYRDGTNEGVGNFLLDIAGQTFIYQLRGKGQWRLEGDTIYSLNTSAQIERRFSPELKQLLLEIPKLKEWEENFYQGMQQDLRANALNHKEFKARILELKDDISLSQEILDNGALGDTSLCYQD